MAGSKISKQSTSCFFIPEELVLKILTFLPILSLLRCKSVCKTWLSIILNPQFIQTHLIESLKKQPSSLLYVLDKSIYVDTRGDSTLLYVLEFFNRPIDTVCSCNGLVCVSNCHTDVIYLGNPTTRQFKKLPPPSEQLDCDEFVLGFGFDDISNDYKILRISDVPEVVDYDDDSVIRALQAEMYSANDDSWKAIQIPEALEYFPISITHRACVNIKGSRVLYFKGTHGLLSFDLHDEVFRVYPYPISCPTPLLHFQLVKSFVLGFEGSVAMTFSESTNDGWVRSLWTLNDVLGNGSWTKEFDLDDSLTEFQVTRLYLGDGQFFECGVGEYILYDYKKNHIKKFPHRPWPKNITEYTETLISLEGFEQLELSGNSLHPVDL